MWKQILARVPTLAKVVDDNHLCLDRYPFDKALQQCVNVIVAHGAPNHQASSPLVMRHLMSRQLPGHNIPESIRDLFSSTNWFMHFDTYAAGDKRGVLNLKMVDAWLARLPEGMVHDYAVVRQLLCAAHRVYDAFYMKRGMRRTQALAYAMEHFAVVCLACRRSEDNNHNSCTVPFAAEPSLPFTTVLQIVRELRRYNETMRYKSSDAWLKKMVNNAINSIMSVRKYCLMDIRCERFSTRELQFEIELEYVNPKSKKRKALPDHATYDEWLANPTPFIPSEVDQQTNADVERSITRVLMPRAVRLLLESGGCALTGYQSFAITCMLRSIDGARIITNKGWNSDYDIMVKGDKSVHVNRLKRILIDDGVEFDVVEDTATRTTIKLPESCDIIQLYECKTYAEVINYHFDYARSAMVYSPELKRYIIWGWPSFWVFIMTRMNVFIRFVTSTKTVCDLILDKFYIRKIGRIVLNPREAHAMSMYIKAIDLPAYIRAVENDDVDVEDTIKWSKTKRWRTMPIHSNRFWSMRNYARAGQLANVINRNAIDTPNLRIYCSTLNDCLRVFTRDNAVVFPSNGDPIPEYKDHIDRYLTFVSLKEKIHARLVYTVGTQTDIEHDGMCISCCSNDPDIMHVECKHCVMCATCFAKTRDKRCPMCRNEGEWIQVRFAVPCSVYDTDSKVEKVCQVTSRQCTVCGGAWKAHRHSGKNAVCESCYISSPHPQPEP